jgi:hypothetical protein
VPTKERPDADKGKTTMTSQQEKTLGFFQLGNWGNQTAERED